MKSRYPFTLIGAAILVNVLGRVTRQDDAHGRAAVGACSNGHVTVQGPRPLLDRLEASSPALAGAVVGDLGRDLTVELLDPDRDARRRPAPDGLADRLADDLIQPDLCVLRQVSGRLQIKVDLDLVRSPGREAPRARC